MNIGHITWKKDYDIKDYDFVALNDHSTYPLLQLDSCAKYIKLFSETAKNENVSLCLRHMGVSIFKKYFI